MRFRPPSADSFSIAVSLWFGSCVYVILPAVGFAPNGAGLAILATGITWTILEQTPERIDQAANRRLYLPLGGVSLLPLLGDLVDDALRTSFVPESATLPAIGFGILGVVLIEAGRGRRARYLRTRETVHFRVEMSESSLRLFILSSTSALAGAGSVRILAGDSVGIPLLIGIVGGTLIGQFVVDTREVDLFVLDRGPVVVPRRRFGVSIIPWRRVRGVSATDRTLHIERGLPFPTRYERAFTTSTEAQQYRDELRHHRRSG